MAIVKPYPRIFIPHKGVDVNQVEDYVHDARYVQYGECKSLLNAARVIMDDFIRLCEYVEPVDANKTVFSLRLHELLLRTATEFEANCKGILLANGYSSRRSLNIRDYHKLNKLMKLDKYVVSTHLWHPDREVCPLKEWESGSSLSWYQCYNASKHDRYANFSKATLENVFMGVCSLAVILAAQFPSHIGSLDISNIRFSLEDDDNSIGTTLFNIKYPRAEYSDLYDFDWESIKDAPDAFDKYAF